jgi:hypothetical protein
MAAPPATMDAPHIIEASRIRALELLHRARATPDLREKLALLAEVDSPVSLSLIPIEYISLVPSSKFVYTPCCFFCWTISLDRRYRTISAQRSSWLVASACH